MLAVRIEIAKLVGKNRQKVILLAINCTNDFSGTTPFVLHILYIFLHDFKSTKALEQNFRSNQHGVCCVTNFRKLFYIVTSKYELTQLDRSHSHITMNHAGISHYIMNAW